MADPKVIGNIPAYMQLFIVICALIAGGLGFYNSVIADGAVEKGVEIHDKSTTSHYDAVISRLNQNDLDEVQTNAEVLAIQKSVKAIEDVVSQTVKEQAKNQREILMLLKAG